MNTSQKVRVRFAPSPTGYLHVGGARTALYNYLIAKKMGGEFILRIEDTDQERSTLASLNMVIEDLKWLGLNWNEGPDLNNAAKDIGPYGPYKQSERLAVYKKVADELIAKGQAYYCFMTDEEIEKQKAAAKDHAHLVSPYANWTLAQAQEKMQAENSKPVVRFKTADLVKDYVFTDLVRGEIRFPSDMVGDFVLLRSDGMPVYNFCCVVDDYMMKMTHVLRAEEHLPNTLRQLMIFEAMNWKTPEFGHVSLILDEDRQKLSKRKGATSCHEFKNEGYMPEALLNFIVLLGWSHPEENKELMTMEEMITGFDLTRFNPAGAVFDAKKLKWMNSVYLRALPDDELWKQLQPFLARENFDLPKDPEWQRKSVQAFKIAMETFEEAIPLYRPLNPKSYVIADDAQEVFTWETSKKVFQTWKELLMSHDGDTFTEAQFLTMQDQVKDRAGVKGKNLFMPIRVAVIGKPHGTELKILVPLMNKKLLLERVDVCLARS